MPSPSTPAPPFSPPRPTFPIQDANCLKCHQDVTQRGYVPKQTVTIPGGEREREGGEEGGNNHWHVFLRAGRQPIQTRPAVPAVIPVIRPAAARKPASRTPKPPAASAMTATAASGVSAIEE